MANAKSAKRVTRRAAAIAQTAELHLPVDALPSIEGWDTLEAEEQTTVTKETNELDRALSMEGKARIEVGQHLFNIREILEPKKVWNKFLLTITRFSRATAYRYISIYEATTNLLPESYVQAAMLRGMNKINLDAVRELPPPKTSNVTAINEYLDTLTTHVSAPREESYNPDTLKRESLNFVMARYQRIPAAGRSRSAWLTSLVGMLLYEHGVRVATTITPLPVPESYKVPRGRPKLVAA